MTKRGVVLPEAAPWEAGFSNSYPSIYHNAGAFELWYNSYLGQGTLGSPTGGGLTQRNVHFHWNETKTQGGAGLRPLAAPATCNSWGGVTGAGIFWMPVAGCKRHVLKELCAPGVWI